MFPIEMKMRWRSAGQSFTPQKPLILSQHLKKALQMREGEAVVCLFVFY